MSVNKYPKCGKKISEKTCLSHGVAQPVYRNKGRKTLVITLIIAFVIVSVILVAASLIPMKKSDKESKSDKQANSLVKEDTVAAPISETYLKILEETRVEDERSDAQGPGLHDENTDESVIHVGESFENEGLKVTISSYNPNYMDYDPVYSPGEGNKYIEVGFAYENMKESENESISVFDCCCLADDVECGQAAVGKTGFIKADLTPGQTVSFKAYYQVPVDAEKLELTYRPEGLVSWGDKSVRIRIQ